MRKISEQEKLIDKVASRIAETHEWAGNIDYRADFEAAMSDLGLSLVDEDSVEALQRMTGGSDAARKGDMHNYLRAAADTLAEISSGTNEQFGAEDNVFADGICKQLEWYFEQRAQRKEAGKNCYNVKFQYPEKALKIKDSFG